MIARRRFLITGIVQGVGFRPFVHGVATRLGLAGFVRNEGFGVVVEVEGPLLDIGSFRSALMNDRPALAVLEAVEEEDVTVLGDDAFTIATSYRGTGEAAPISPDLATCADCLRELFDPLDRRFGYPFINCTACGPRFTITLRVPYDRVNTTMAPFEMCEDCRSEYGDPADRRFHAEPIACPRCGPQLQLVFKEGNLGGEPIEKAGALIASGSIVAIKGLGGYHLACDATNHAAVERLRARKAREEKPLAVMVADASKARDLVLLNEDEERQLGSHRAPIVLTRRRDGGQIAAGVAPGNEFIGVMLPYTPLHHLLMKSVSRPLVFTSANASEEPLAYDDDDALRRLAKIADAFLVHDRKIHMRCDDSVVRVKGTQSYPLRRSRGYAPEPLQVGVVFPEPVLAVGAELKNVFCIGVGKRALLSHHIGDLENWEAFRSFVEGVGHFERVFDVSPRVVAHDLHPEYLSTKWAKGLDDVELVAVQHHHAHIASCLADNQRSERVIGVALDGTGYGEDGTIWGGEVLVCDLASYDRVAHLRRVTMPGGRSAIREPWRMAAVYLDAAFGSQAGDVPLDFVRRTRDRWGPILQMATKRVNSPSTSSAGRLFDAAAALCGVRDRVTYEGQAAAELEQLADRETHDAYPCAISGGVIDGVGLFRALAEDLAAGRAVQHAAAAFHNGLAGGVVGACIAARESHGLDTVALSGGTFQNVLLLEAVGRRLAEHDFEVLTHHRVPPNDGGISLGQAVAAAARRHQRSSEDPKADPSHI